MRSDDRPGYSGHIRPGWALEGHAGIYQQGGNFVGLAGQARGTPWQLVMAVSTVMMLPVVVIFFLAQRRFIEGIAASGIKA